jgi:hypothetical protein
MVKEINILQMKKILEIKKLQYIVNHFRIRMGELLKLLRTRKDKFTISLILINCININCQHSIIIESNKKYYKEIINKICENSEFKTFSNEYNSLNRFKVSQYIANPCIDICSFNTDSLKENLDSICRYCLGIGIYKGESIKLKFLKKLGFSRSPLILIFSKKINNYQIAELTTKVLKNHGERYMVFLFDVSDTENPKMLRTIVGDKR